MTLVCSAPRDENFQYLLSPVLLTCIPEKLQETWTNIELDDAAKDNITRMISSTVSSTSSYGILKGVSFGGALLYGPPGTGKTLLARVLAKESGAAMIHVSAAELESKWAGETPKLIKALFQLARMIFPSILFIDEADGLFRSRSSPFNGYERERKNQLLAESDGMSNGSEPRPFLLLATNYPTELDQAVLRRVPGRIYLGPPSCAQRARMFEMFLREEDLDKSVDIQRLSDATPHYTGSDIKTLCMQAASICASEMARPFDDGVHSRRVLLSRHFETALTTTSATFSVSAMEEIKRFARENDPQSLKKMFSADKPSLTRTRTTPIPRMRVDDAAPHSPRQESMRRDQHKSLPSPSSQSEESITSSRIPTLPTSECIYQPLDPSIPQIRLIEITCSGSSNDKIQCVMNTVDLSENPSFVALSYVWGDPSETEEILLNGIPHAVTASLASALHWVQHHWGEVFPERDPGEFRLWADALSINQR